MTHAADFPLELDAVLVAHLLADHLAERFDREGIGLAEIEQEIGVQLANLRAAEGQAPAPGFVDQPPARIPLGVLEGRAAGLGAGRLRAFALLGDFAHALEDVVLSPAKPWYTAETNTAPRGPFDLR